MTTFADKIISVSQITEIGDYVLSLYDIDDTFYPNPRGVETWDEIKVMYNSLGMNDAGQQINNINCTIEVLESDRLVAAVNAGYTRTEGMRRNALKKICEQWNEENKLTPAHKDYIDPICENLNKHDAAKKYDLFNQVGGKWKEMYENALKAYPVGVKVVSINKKGQSDKKAARKLGVKENLLRNDMSLKAIVNSIYAMKTEDGMSGKQIAEELQKSTAIVSMWLSIYDVCDNMKKVAEESKATDEQREILEACIVEFNRRSSIPATEPDSIVISHARDFAIFVNGAKKYKVKFNKLLLVFCKLTGVDENAGLPNKNFTRMDYSIFKGIIDSIKNESTIKGGAPGEQIKPEKLIDKAISEQLTATEVAKEIKQDDQLAFIQDKLGLTDDAIAASIDAAIKNKEEAILAKKGKEIVAEQEDTVDFAAIASQAATQATEAADKSKEILEKIKSEEESTIEEPSEDDSETSIDNIDLTSLLPATKDEKAEDIEEDEEDEDNEEEEKLTGEKSLSRIDVSEKKFEVKSVQALISKITTAKKLIDIADTEKLYQYVDVIFHLTTITNMYDVISDGKKFEKFNKQLLVYMDNMQSMVFALIEHARKNMTHEQFVEIEKMMPKFDKELLND